MLLNKIRNVGGSNLWESTILESWICFFKMSNLPILYLENFLTEIQCIWYCDSYMTKRNCFYIIWTISINMIVRLIVWYNNRSYFILCHVVFEETILPLYYKPVGVFQHKFTQLRITLVRQNFEKNNWTFKTLLHISTIPLIKYQPSLLLWN